METLAKEAGKEPLEDRFRAGYLAAIYDLQNIEIEEVDLGD